MTKLLKTFNVFTRPLARMSTNPSETIRLQNDLFNAERKRQTENIGRIEKIDVQYDGVPEKATLIMNRSISTPYNCAQHLGQMHMERSVLASINGEPWDMHRPLEKNCTLDFVHFTANDTYHVNKAYWRSCSFLLGALVSQVFKDDVRVTLHSFPSPQVKSGSFVYDVDLSLNDWQPRTDELRVMSLEMIKLCSRKFPFERLNVTQAVAENIFATNKYKSAQIPNIAEHNDGNVTLYRVGTHIDISCGPMIANTCFVGRFTMAAVHRITSTDGLLYRFQGVSLPKSVIINHFAFRILEERAKKLNQARLPNAASESVDHVKSAMA